LALDVISTIESAEAEALRLKNEAVLKAKELLAGTETEGKRTVEAASAKAQQEIRSYEEKLREDTTRELAEIKNTGEREQAAIRENACAKLSAVSEMIKERIVNGK